jgi:hypothetical protein
LFFHGLIYTNGIFYQQKIGPNVTSTFSELMKKIDGMSGSYLKFFREEKRFVSWQSIRNKSFFESSSERSEKLKPFHNGLPAASSATFPAMLNLKFDNKNH